MIDEPIRDPHTDELVKKTVFVVFAHGQQILDKVRRICESLGATIYPVDPSPAKRSEHQLEVAARIEDLNNVLYNTQATRRAELAKIAEVMDQWMVMVRKEKATLHTMNLFNYDGTRKCLIAEGWCPTNAITTIQYALHGASERSGSMIPPVLNTLKTTAEPPTYHKTNRFTKAFQTLIDAYGMAKYKEVNPGLFTVTTFPFLFAMMFGDFGQGGMMFLIGAYMVWNERRMMSKPLAEVSVAILIQDNLMFSNTAFSQMLKMLFAGRYIVMMMGVFSIYVGLIYDDIFSFSVNMSPSGWAFKSGTNETETVFVSTYPFGLDPVCRREEGYLKLNFSIINKCTARFS